MLLRSTQTAMPERESSIMKVHENNEYEYNSAGKKNVYIGD